MPANRRSVVLLEVSISEEKGQLERFYEADEVRLRGGRERLGDVSTIEGSAEAYVPGLFAAAGALLLAAAMPVGAAGPADHSYRTSPSAISGEVGAFFFSGFTVTGSNCDDCTTPITFPFPLTFYGQTYTSGLAGANGNLQLTGDSTSLSSGCLPNAELGAAIMPFQRDLRTNGTNDHISTRVTGTSPNRLFGIAWVTHFFVSADTATFGVLFRENDPRIEIAYFGSSDSGLSAVSGVQASGSGPFTQFSCQAATLTGMVTYIPTAGLAITKKGAGHGRVTSAPAGIACGTACSAVYDVPTQVTLSAAPRKGSYFAGWSGGGCSGKGSCTMRLDHPMPVRARFEKLCPGFFDDPRHQIAGTRKADLLVGTRRNDIICGLDGKDELRGKGGKDLLLGGRGNDRLIGGRGKDVALGGPGDDRCFAELKQSC